MFSVEQNVMTLYHHKAIVMKSLISTNG